VLLVWGSFRGQTVAPTYQRVTFDHGTVYSARFTPDFRGIVYGAAWNGRPRQLFSTVGNSLLSQPLNLIDANLLAISRTGELALALHGGQGAHLEPVGAMLARAPLAGGAPRGILNDVSWADWDANGELAVAHQVQGHDRIEYPIGHVLYQTTGWVSHIRIAPRGDKIAFMDHPTLWDDRGSVAVVDLNGHFGILSSGWESEDGLAWSPDEKEIWFTAVERGSERQLLGVTESAHLRRILGLPGGMTLEDLAPNGQALVSLDTERLNMETVARNGKPVDISWHDWSVTKDLSSDGQWVLFEDSSEAGGNEYSIAVRKVDGSLPIQLGGDSSGGLSPDGKWAISILPGSPGKVTLIPTGASQQRTIPTAGLEKIFSGAGHFLADGKRFTLNASEHGHGFRCYLLNIDGGDPVPITPEGITGGIVSPDGKYVVRADESGVLALYPIPDGAPLPIPHLEAGFTPIQWTDDNSSIYIHRRGPPPTAIYKVNLATGQKTLVAELTPQTTTGVVSLSPIVVTRDASRFAYSYYEILSELVVISGLK
jgi:eukaryotic-like serine/threonine-protein kinase